MEIRRLIIVAFCLALTSTAAYSMHHEETVADKASGFYGGVDAGVAFVKYSSNPFFGRALVGYNRGPLALEVGYFESDRGNLTYYDAKIKSRGADFSLVVRPFAKYDFEHFFVRGGGHYSEVTLGTSSYGGATFGATTSGLGWLAGAGLELPLTEALSIQAAYTHYGSAAGENLFKFDAITAGLRFNF